MNYTGNGRKDRELVSRFLKRVSRLSGEEIEASVPGVTQSDVSRWRNRKWKRLTARKRRALEAHLGELPDLEAEYQRGFSDGVEYARSRIVRLARELENN